MRWDNYFRKLSRSRDSDNEEEIYERACASADELPPVSIFRRLIEERSQASNDENEVPHATECHHRGFGPPHLSGMHKKPECDRSSLHEVSHEEIKTVPEDADRDARATPHILLRRARITMTT
jgi:hypothetical protein